MGKILTISVAAYNVAPYIEENLDSILASDLRENIEIFVVDDGGKDESYALASAYEKKYPGTVHAVHKENGGYGSVQNYSIAHASGKYFKILDGDDWMDTDGLTMLIRYLKNTDVDAVITGYYRGPDKNHLRLKKMKLIRGKSVSGVPFDANILNDAIGMWSVTFKTEVIRRSGLVLPEHTLYTDRIFSAVPFSCVKQAAILDTGVYCYRIGREGQSVSRESRIKHIDEYLKVTETICRHYAADRRAHKEYLLLKAAYGYKVTIRALLLLPTEKANLEKLIHYEKQIKKISKEVYVKSASLKTRMGWMITFLRMTGYRGYWILGKVPRKIIDY